MSPEHPSADRPAAAARSSAGAPALSVAPPAPPAPAAGTASRPGQTRRWRRWSWATRLAGLLLTILAVWFATADLFLVRPVAPLPGDSGRFVSVDGVRTYFRVQGPGAPVVLLHGQGISSETWRAAERGLAAGSTVYSPDLVGFGYTDEPSGYDAARDLARFARRFLDAVGVERATVVGCSLGGATALWLAAEHPDRVERLVLVNAAEIAPAAPVFRLLAVPLVGPALLKTTTPWSMRAMMADAYAQKGAATTQPSTHYARVAWSPGARDALVRLARGYEVDRGLLRARLAGIATPSLVIWTDRDPYFPVVVGEELARLLPRAELRVIRNAGHLPQEEQPGAFGDAVLEWLVAERNRPTGRR